MEDLISIIIPIYNVEKYVKSCINSVLNQTYKNIEIILVDDGSTDSSSIICDEYKKLDNRVVIIHKKNGGLSSARNVGLDVAKGNYICFIDSDDVVAEKFIYDLYNLIKNNNCDVSICGYVRFTDKINNANKAKNNEYYLTGYEVLKKILYQSKQQIFSVSVCNKMFNQQIFNKLRFPIDKLNEDVAIITDIFNSIEKVGIVENYNYYYRITSNSITTNKFSKKNMDVIEFCEKIIEKYKNDKILYLAAINLYFRRNVEMISKIYKLKNRKDYKNEERKLLNNIKKYRKTIIVDYRSKLSSKLTAIVSYLNIKIAIDIRNFLH